MLIITDSGVSNTYFGFVVFLCQVHGFHFFNTVRDPNSFYTLLQEDPALTRWVFARANPYTYFKPTFKTSLLGAMFGVVPLFALYFIFKTDRV